MVSQFIAFMLSNFICSKDWIVQDLPNQIWEAQALAGGDLPIWVTRLFHNKLTMYSTNFLRCGLYHLAPDYIARRLTFVGLFFWLIAVFSLAKNRRYLALVIIGLSSLLIVFQRSILGFSSEVVFTSVQALVAIYGLIISIRYLVKRQ